MSVAAFIVCPFAILAIVSFITLLPPFFAKKPAIVYDPNMSFVVLKLSNALKVPI